MHDVIAWLAGDLSGRRVIDLGAGSAGTLVRLREAQPALAVAVDLNIDGLRERPGSDSRLVADLALPLPLKSGSVDVIVSHNTLECLARPDSFLRECHRILASDGHLLLAHTEFASITLNTSDRELCRRLLRTYCELPVLYRFMQQADAQMGRQLTGLAHKEGFAVAGIWPHVKIETSLRGDAASRVGEIAWSVRRAVSTRQTDLTHADVDRWLSDLSARDEAGDFFFSETAYVIKATPRNARPIRPKV